MRSVTHLGARFLVNTDDDQAGDVHVRDVPKLCNYGCLRQIHNDHGVHQDKDVGVDREEEDKFMAGVGSADWSAAAAGMRAERAAWK